MPQPHADTTQRREKMVLSTRNDLGVEVREKATALLNQHLADATDLYSQTKQAHWNVKGMQFSQLHELFDTLADSVEEFVDLIAERVTSLGGVACGTVRLSAAASRLPEYPLDARNGRQHLEALAVRFSTLAASSRAAIDAANAIPARIADLNDQRILAESPL